MKGVKSRRFCVPTCFFRIQAIERSALAVVRAGKVADTPSGFSGGMIGAVLGTFALPVRAGGPSVFGVGRERGDRGTSVAQER